MRRPAPSGGAPAVSLVSESTWSEIVPDTPRSLEATEVNSASGRASRAATTTRPTRRRTRMVGTTRAMP